MVEQLKFLLMEIDREATRQKVEEALERAAGFKWLQIERREMKMTPSYSPRYHGETNEIGRPAEEVALENIAKEEYQKNYVERIERAVKRLSQRERRIVEERYLIQERALDYQIYMDLHMSERSYYRMKSRAFYKLAFILGIEVYAGEIAS